MHVDDPVPHPLGRLGSIFSELVSVNGTSAIFVLVDAPPVGLFIASCA